MIRPLRHLRCGTAPKATESFDAGPLWLRCPSESHEATQVAGHSPHLAAVWEVAAWVLSGFGLLRVGMRYSSAVPQHTSGANPQSHPVTKLRAPAYVCRGTPPSPLRRPAETAPSAVRVRASRGMLRLANALRPPYRRPHATSPMLPGATVALKGDLRRWGCAGDMTPGRGHRSRRRVPTRTWTGGRILP